MKKIGIMALMLSALTVLGCNSSNRSNDEFANKEKCSLYLENIVTEWNLDHTPITTDNVEEVFYSRKLNSCIYVVKETEIWGIYDFLSKREILALDSPLVECNFSGGYDGDAELEKCEEEITTKIASKVSELKRK